MKISVLLTWIVFLYVGLAYFAHSLGCYYVGIKKLAFSSLGIREWWVGNWWQLGENPLHLLIVWVFVLILCWQLVAKMLVRRRMMSWRRIAKSLQAFAAHAFLFSFKLLLHLKLDHLVDYYSWWSVFVLFFFIKIASFNFWTILLKWSSKWRI